MFPGALAIPLRAKPTFTAASLWPHNGRNLAAFTEISSELLRCRFPAQGTNYLLTSISEWGSNPSATAKALRV
jgi:hypothetical protein